MITGFIRSQCPCHPYRRSDQILWHVTSGTPLGNQVRVKVPLQTDNLVEIEMDPTQPDYPRSGISSSMWF